MVIGFVGGFVRHDNMVHSGVQLAQHLRRDYPSDICVEVFENRRRERAHQEILRLLDTNRDGRLSVEEKHSARIILYGMSWGGAETVMLAQELEKDGIPVLLTVQVDSISKIRQNDAVIPSNVAEAINFQEAEQGNVATTGDFVLTGQEVNSVISALEEHNIQVTGLHNHMLSEQPRLFFMHFWGVGTPANVSAGIKAALSKIAVK